MVTVAANGNLERIRVLESSGDTRLDRAAQDTVVLAAPFPPFSEALAKRTRRLDIVRTWQFRSQPAEKP
jgi:protein TonB